MEEITTSTLNQKKEIEREKKETLVPSASRNKKQTSKFLSSLFSVDDVSNIKDYVVYDCIVPAFKNTVVDLIENTVSMIFYGDTKGSRGRSKSGFSSRVSYADYYNNGKRETSSRGPAGRYDKVDADEIGFDNRADVMRIRDLICEDLDRYKHLTIAEFYDFCGQTASITDNKYGWTANHIDEIMRLNRDSAIRPNRHGQYIINMPPAIPMD